MAVRGLRGATCLAADDTDEMKDAVLELLGAMLDRNGLGEADLISIVFTATPDVRCGFPATAARSLGLADVPLICAQEMDVPGSLPRVIRILALAETELARADIQHVFLRGAQVLRQDLVL